MRTRWVLVVLAVVMGSGCAGAIWFTGWRTLAIQRVNLGDTRQDVIRKLGNPDQVVSKTLTSNGREEVIWLYEAVRRSSVFGKRVDEQKLTDQVLGEQRYQLDRLQNPPYLITLIDGKVVEISRKP